MKHRPPKVAKATPTPAGVIRRGQRKPFRKCTEAERDDRVELLARQISQKPMSTEGELKAFVRSKFGLSHRQAGEYIARARDAIRRRTAMPKQRVKEFVVGKLLFILSSGKPGEAMKAARQLSAIYGIDQPHRVELTGAQGGPVKTEDTTPMPSMTPKRLAEVLQSLAAAEDPK